MSNKIYVLDTSIILAAVNTIFSFSDNEVVLPYVVLEELDSHKTHDSDTGRNAREVIRQLNKLREKGRLNEGVPLNEIGGTLRIELNFSSLEDDRLKLELNDDRIINVCIGLKRKNPNKQVVLVSNDINLTIKADVLGVCSEQFETDKTVDRIDQLYTGCVSLEIESKIINQIYSAGDVCPADILDISYPNQYITLTGIGDPSKSVLVKVKQHNEPLVRVKPASKNVYGISPKNREQFYAFDALLDPNVPLVSLTGKAGCGKTLISLACALHMVQETNQYDRLIISRPIQPLGKEIGFLPGDIHEKMSPWMGPIKDALDFLFSKKDPSRNMYQEMLDLGELEVEPLTFIRGRSLPRTIFLIDEAEDLSKSEMKTIVSRMGEGSKLILIGDVLQITNPYLNVLNNGLSHVIEKFKFYEMASHITLERGERSTLATLASEIL